MNSRPPPCEGDALPAELLPHMGATTRRSVVCMPFMCRGQVFFAGGTSGGRGHAAVTGRAGLPRDPAPPGERLPLVLRLLADPARPGASRRKGKRLPARGRGRRGQCAVPVTRVVFPGALFWRMRAVSMPGRPRNGNAAPGPPGRQRPHGPERRAAFPGSPSSGHALQKNRPGRPCGAWLPRKKTL